MIYFRYDNTDGYSARDLDILNIRVDEILAEMGDIGEDDPNHADNVKNACDRAHNEFILSRRSPAMGSKMVRSGDDKYRVLFDDDGEPVMVERTTTIWVRGREAANAMMTERLRRVVELARRADD